MDTLAGWGVLLMAGSMAIGLMYCAMSIGFSAGIFHYQTLAVDAFRQRFCEITGSTVEDYVNAIPRFQRFRCRIPVADGPVKTIGDGLRAVTGRPLLLNNERRWKILQALQDGPAWRITDDTGRRLLAVALYCANLPTNEPPPDAVKARAFSGLRQAEFLLYRTKVEVDDAQSVEELFIAYQNYRAVVRRKWFHALTGGRRKILKARATPQVIFWKKMLGYSAAGGGAGALLFLGSLALRSDSSGQLSVIGGGLGVFLFAVGVVKAYHRGRLEGQTRTRYRLFVQKQPLVATGLMSGQVVIVCLAGIVALFLALVALSFAQGLLLGLAVGLMGDG